MIFNIPLVKVEGGGGGDGSLNELILQFDLMKKFTNSNYVITEEDYTDENITIIDNALTLLVDGGE